MKVSTLLLIVGGLSAYLFLTTVAIFHGNIDPACTFWPDSDCLVTKFKALSAIQKRQLLSMLFLDYVYLISYSLLLGIWIYREMQRQAWLWLNTWLRFCLLVVFILGLTDIAENILLGQLLNGITSPFQVLALVICVKWGSSAFLFLSLLMSMAVRRARLFLLFR